MAFFLWPAEPHAVFDGLAEKLEVDVGSVISVELSDLTTSTHDGDTVVMVLTGAGERAAEGLGWLKDVAGDSRLNVLVVVDDSYIGSGVNRAHAQVCGAAIAAMRSLSVQRGTTVRANAICVPEGLTGEPGELRGPLPGEPDIDDLAAAIGLFTGPDGGYLSGQVLYMNGGRQLFSSHTS